MATLRRRYVNKDADAGGNGTTSALSSGDNTHAYQSLATFDSSEAKDITLGTGTDDWFECNCAGSTQDTTAVLFGTDWVTDAANDNWLEIVGENTPLQWDTSKYRLNPSKTYGYSIEFQTAAFKCHDIQIGNTGATDGAGFGVNGALFDAGYLENCIIYETAASPNVFCHAVTISGGSGNSGTLYTRDNVMSGWGGRGYYINGGVGICTNNTIEGCNEGMYGYSYVNYTGHYLINNLVVNNITNDWGLTSFHSGYVTALNNTDSDASSPSHTGLVPNATVTFTSATDWHIDDVGESELIGAGIGPADATYGSYILSPDPDGNIRSGSTTDIGADLFVLTGYTLTAEVGTFSVSGYDADLVHGADIVLTAETGVFNVSGDDANLEQGYSLSAEVGVFNVTGNPAELIHSYGLLAETGVFNVSGDDANLEHTHILVAETGTFSITGYDAALSVAADIVLLAEAGTFSISGNDANLEQGYSLLVEAGVFNVSGDDVNLEQGYSLSAEAGTFSISGNDANLEQGYSLLVEAGVFGVTGYDANLFTSADKTLLAEAGVFNVSGNNANLLKTNVLSSEAGTFSISGNDANLEHSYTMIAEASVFSVTGYDVNTFVDYNLIAEAGTFVVTVPDADLEHSYTMIAEAGVFSVTGYDAGLLSLNKVLTAEAGVFNITGYPAALSEGGESVLLAETGVFNISGNDANLEQGYSLSAEAGTFSISGNDIDIALDRVMAAEAGTFTITGYEVIQFYPSGTYFTNFITSFEFDETEENFVSIGDDQVSFAPGEEWDVVSFDLDEVWDEISFKVV